MARFRPALLVLLGVLVLALSACAGAEDAATEADPTEGAATDDGSSSEIAATDGAEPTSVVVTTAILGDIVSQVLAGTGAEVQVIMPSGVDPHAYEASASDGLALREADLVVANGLQLEEALLDVLASVEADGVSVLEVAEELDGLLEPGAEGHDHSHGGESGDDHEGESHADDEDRGDEAGEDHADDEDHDEHDHGEFDPHVWLDPINVGEMAGIIADAYAAVDVEAADTVAANAATVVAAMTELDTELQGLVSTLDEGQRRLVTNHESLGYLAAHYDLEVIATVLPGTSTDVDVTASSFTELVETIRDAGVPAIFADTSSSDRLAQSLAEEVGGIEVVELYTESLGEPGSGADTVAGMIRTNIERIVEALG